MYLKDLFEDGGTVFASEIWADEIDQIRQLLDPAADNAYTFNSVDAYMLEEYGDLEMLPGLLHDDYTPDMEAVQLKVDAIFGKNKDYWIRMLDSLLAHFDPLYNVDAYETQTTAYGSHEVTDARGARQRTDTLAPTQETTQHGAQGGSVTYGATENTEGRREDSTTDGAQTITRSESTMDDLTFKAKSQDTHAAVNNSSVKGQQVNSSAQHIDSTSVNGYTDTVSTIQAVNTSADAAATDKTTSGAHTDTVTIRRYGNIGVTMSTQLLTDFQRFARESKLVPIISEELVKALCFCVWY